MCKNFEIFENYTTDLFSQTLAAGSRDTGTFQFIQLLTVVERRHVKMQQVETGLALSHK